MFTTALALLLAPALVAAQYGGLAAAGTTTASSSVPTAPPSTSGQINIEVAGTGFVYNPANVTAAVGTLITFYFPNSGLNHSVTQSAFAEPCTPLAANSSANTPAGFDSGLQSAVTFTINITDTKPIWFFCKQVTHCGLGMVGSINAPTTGTNTFAAFRAAALAIGGNEPIITDNGPVIAGVNAVAIGSPSPDASGATSTSTDTNADTDTDTTGATSTSTGATSTSTGATSTSTDTDTDTDTDTTGATSTSTSTGSSSSSSSGAMKLMTNIGFALFPALLGVAMA